MSNDEMRFPRRLHRLEQQCDRRGCENGDPLTDIAASPMKPAEWRVETPGTSVEDGIFVCEECATEFGERVVTEEDLSPSEFVAD
jgi:hypothetical protein